MCLQLARVTCKTVTGPKGQLFHQGPPEQMICTLIVAACLGKQELVHLLFREQPKGSSLSTKHYFSFKNWRQFNFHLSFKTIYPDRCKTSRITPERILLLLLAPPVSATRGEGSPPLADRSHQKNQISRV